MSEPADMGIGPRRRRALAVALLALAAALPAPAAALAHAELESTVPARGEVLRQSPPRVVFEFSEPVEAGFGAIRVFDADGARVEEGDPFHPDGRSGALAVAVRPGLPDGTYTATYRVVSADSHVISGGVVFSVGAPGATGATVAELLEGEDSGAATTAMFGVARALQFGALAVALGALAFLVLVWRRARAGVAEAANWPAAASAFARRLRALVVGAALLGALSGALGILMQGAQAAGVPIGEALDGAIVEETLGTRFGTVWGAGVLAWLLLAAIAWGALRPAGAERAPAATADGFALAPGVRPLAALAMAPAVLFLLLLPGLGGHAAAQSPVAVLLPANAVHVAAMSVWAGGLATLLLALPAATRALREPAERSRLLAAVLLRFSPLALGAVGVILLTGIAQSLLHLDRVGDLVDTGFGQAILAKAILLAALVAIGAWQRRRSVPQLRAIAADGGAPGRAGVLLRRALRAEVLLLAGVLAATAALAASSPLSAASDGGPFDQTTELGPLQLQVTVDPAAVGPNAVHLYLLDPGDGSQFEDAREVTLTATQPARDIGPIRQTPDLAGPGHYTVSAMSFGVAGTWDLRVTVRVSDFDQYETTLEVPIR